MDLNLNASFPGETLVVALLNFATKRAERMDPDLLKRLDTILVQQAEDLQGVWRSTWVKLGVVKDTVK
jgi:hypothetical protein